MILFKNSPPGQLTGNKTYVSLERRKGERRRLYSSGLTADPERRKINRRAHSSFHIEDSIDLDELIKNSYYRPEVIRLSVKENIVVNVITVVIAVVILLIVYQAFYILFFGFKN